MKHALIIGATGLVGSELLNHLLESPEYDKITIFVRRTTGIDHQKLAEHIINFDDVDSWKQKVSGDVLFSALGTTLKKAGSKKAQYKVDYHYQYNFAKSASENDVPHYVLISSAGASPKSGIFYSRMKGELDRDVKKLTFERIVVLKPSLLAGERENKRIGEEIAAGLGKVIKYIPGLKKYRPIQAKTVARAMTGALKKDPEEKITEYELDELFELARKGASDH